MSAQIKNFHNALPDCPSLKGFLNWHALDVHGLDTMQSENRVF